MKAWIFLTKEGSTFPPGDIESGSTIDNLQVLGFGFGKSEEEAFKHFCVEYKYLLDSRFDEVICMELKNLDYFKAAKYFYLRM